jgi:prophage DNA circulation protein
VSTPSELVLAVQALAAGVADSAADPMDRVRLLAALAAASPAENGNAALAAVGRRAALAALARAAASATPRSYDEAQALRGSVCGLLAAEELVAADAGEDAVVAALRALRGAVDRDLSRRGANLSPLRALERDEPLPALVLAQRLYGDGARADGLIEECGDVPNPCFLAGQFKVRAR